MRLQRRLQTTRKRWQSVRWCRRMLRYSWPVLAKVYQLLGIISLRMWHWFPLERQQSNVRRHWRMWGSQNIESLHGNLSEHAWLVSVRMSARISSRSRCTLVSRHRRMYNGECLHWTQWNLHKHQRQLSVHIQKLPVRLYRRSRTQKVIGFSWNSFVDSILIRYFLLAVANDYRWLVNTETSNAIDDRLRTRITSLRSFQIFLYLPKDELYLLTKDQVGMTTLTSISSSCIRRHHRALNKLQFETSSKWIYMNFNRIQSFQSISFSFRLQNGQIPKRSTIEFDANVGRSTRYWTGNEHDSVPKWSTGRHECC